MIAYKHSSVVPRDADVQNFRIFVGMLRICYTVYTTIDNHSCIHAYVYMYMHMYIWVPVTIATGMLLMVLIKGTEGDIRGSLIENHSCMVHMYIVIWVPVTVAIGMLLTLLVEGTGGDTRGSLAC